MRIARVFPRKTKATPTDDLAFCDVPGLFPPDVDQVDISVAFSWDLQRAVRLANAWEKVAPTRIGGPAIMEPSGDFHPGMYLKPGYVITSRGCPNHCWFCGVWKRDGKLRELPITEGHNILDDNLLACSEPHIRAVFDMLGRQTERAQFTGGFEAERLQEWHVDLLAKLKPRVDQMFFAFDQDGGDRDRDPLIRAGRLLQEAGFTRHHLRCYVLIGHPYDEFYKAERRLRFVWNAGFVPMAMLYRDEKGRKDPGWASFQREWARPAIIKTREKAKGPAANRAQ